MSIEHHYAAEAPSPAFPQIGYGDRIRLLRRELGMTVDEFAASIRATTSTVGRHEGMRNKPEKNTYAIPALIELRWGKRWPGGVSHWLLEGHALGEAPATCPECAARDSNPEPADYGTVLIFQARERSHVATVHYIAATDPLDGSSNRFSG